jgi:hypothetical protein
MIFKLRLLMKIILGMCMLYTVEAFTWYYIFKHFCHEN